MKRKLIVLLALTLAISSAAFAGCTPESPPIKEPVPAEESLLQNESSASEQSETSAAESGSNTETEKSEISAEASRQEEKSAAASKTEVSPASSQSAPPEQTDYIEVWKNDSGTPVKMNYSQELMSGITNYKCSDINLINRLIYALKDIKVLGKTTERYDDDSDEITFNFQDGSECLIVFEHGGFLSGNIRYDVEGYSEVKEALEAIKVSSVNDGTEKSYDEWIMNMSKVDNKISILCGSDEYTKADTDKKNKLAIALLTELENEGLIEKGSICSSNDIVSFEYAGGGLGGIMFREFDPMMN